MTGVALATSSVSVNGSSAGVVRQGEYFAKELAVTNGSGPVWADATVSVPGCAVAGGLPFPGYNQPLGYDADGNLTFDGIWTYEWDAENRLSAMTITNVAWVPDVQRKRVEFAYDALGHRTPRKEYSLARTLVTGVSTNGSPWLRNEVGGWVGFEFEVGNTPLTVSELGRWVVWGDSGTHTVKLVTYTGPWTGTDVPGGSTVVSMAGKPARSFAYAALSAPVMLLANTRYYVLSQEVVGGDQWYNYDGCHLTLTGLATPTGSCWCSEGSSEVHWNNDTNQSYVPVSCLYTEWVGVQETRDVYDGMQVVQERDEDNLPTVTYTRGLDLSGSLQGAGGIGGLLARTSNPQLPSANAHAFYHGDGNGNITALVDAAQNVVARYSYDPFGGLLGLSGRLAEANLYRFSSKEWHPNSGLYYYGYRFYQPGLQRWLNRDPMGNRPLALVRRGRTRQVPAGVLVGPNLYSFVHNNPNSYVDPYGLWGIQFGDFNIGIGDPTLAFDWDSWGDLGQGAAATADGIIPFGNPFEKYYNPCDPLFKASKRFGQCGRNVALVAAIPNIGTWVRNPFLYELGQSTVPRAVFEGVKDLGAIERGAYYLGNYGFGGTLNLTRAASAADWGATIGTWPTPGGWILIGGIGEGIDNSFFW